jgi:hypothetical protein
LKNHLGMAALQPPGSFSNSQTKIQHRVVLRKRL